MADDNIEQQIAFIIDQQAKNTVNIARMQEGMTDLRDALLSLANFVERHDEQIAILVEEGKEAKAEFKEIRALFKEIALQSKENEARFQENEARFKEIALRFKETDERFKKTDERMSKTDERLNAIIALIEK